MPDPTKPTVLIVEDNPVNMKLAADLLEFNGFHVLKATDGEGALRLVTNGHPDVVLLDIHLPGMDGFEVLRRIRQAPDAQTLRVVALTALAMREEEEKIRAAGFTDYIAKPIDTKQFVQKVRTLAGLR